MILESILFGILQGIFEWLPISSQGNLVLLMVGFFGMVPENALRLAIFLHTGTLLSALFYFRKDVIDILRGLRGFRVGYGDEKNALITFLVVSTLVTGIVGYPLFKYFSAASFAGEVFLGLVGLALIATGILQRMSQGKASVDRKLNMRDTILLGILQGISVIPGISRSGITVSGFLFRKYSSQDALKLSFLMSIPAVLVAEIGMGLMDSLPSITLYEALAGIAISFAFGLATIKALLGVASRVKFWKFCIVMGILALVPMVFYIV